MLLMTLSSVWVWCYTPLTLKKRAFTGVVMLPNAFETYLREARIDRVTIFRSSPESAWSIYAYGEELPPEVTNALELNERGSPRLWGDLEAAYAFIRKSGFTSLIEIDG